MDSYSDGYNLFGYHVLITCKTKLFFNLWLFVKLSLYNSAIYKNCVCSPIFIKAKNPAILRKDRSVDLLNEPICCLDSYFAFPGVQRLTVSPLSLNLEPISCGRDAPFITQTNRKLLGGIIQQILWDKNLVSNLAEKEIHLAHLFCSYGDITCACVDI